jgi:serine/threonine protein kinase
MKPIGQGKFSYVFQAQNTRTGQEIALKLLKIFDMNDVKQRDNCIKEVKLMEKLNHENITKYIESFIQENEMFIAVEWAANGDLKEHIKKIKQKNEVIPERQIWKYIS